MYDNVKYSILCKYSTGDVVLMVRLQLYNHYNICTYTNANVYVYLRQYIRNGFTYLDQTAVLVSYHAILFPVRVKEVYWWKYQGYYHHR